MLSGYGERFNPNYLGNGVRKLIDAVQIYVAVSITQLRETHARCHPRGKLP